MAKTALKTARKSLPVSDATAKASGLVKAAAKAAKLETPANLSAVTSAAFGYGRNRAAAFIAIVKAGGGDTARRAWHVGYMASIFNPKAETLTDAMRAHAEKVLDYVGVGAKSVPAGSGRRTDAQEKAYAASRTAWKVVNQKAGKAPDASKRRAPQASKVAEKDAAKVSPIVAAPAAPVQTTPHFTKPAECVAHLNLQAASLLAFANKNAKAMPIAARNIVGEFHKAMTELVKSMAEEAAKEEAKAPLKGQAMLDYQASQRQ